MQCPLPRAFIEGFQRCNVLCREQGAGVLVDGGLRFFLVQQRYAAHISPEGVEVRRGQAAARKERLRRCQHSRQIPGDEIQIPMIQSGGSTQESHGFRSGLVQNGLL